MHRRKFLQLLGAGAAVAAVAPYVPFKYLTPSTETLGVYTDYANFSSIAIATDIDECVLKAAEELGYRAALDLNKIVLDNFAN